MIRPIKNIYFSNKSIQSKIKYFISGTLGLVTRIALACPPRPNAINVSFLGLESYAKVLETFKAARKNLGEVLSSCEFIDAGSLECVTQNLGLQSPLQDKYPFYMLIETSGSK